MMSNRISPKAPRDEEQIQLEFARTSQFTTGIVVQGNLCGYVSIHDIDLTRSCAEITAMIGDETLWGAGIGAEAVENTINMFGELSPDNRELLIHAFIRKSNSASWKMFRRLGFEEYFSLDSLPPGYSLHPNDRLFRRKVGT